MSEYPCDGPVSASILLAAGRCEVTAEERDTVSVEIAPHRKDKRSVQAAEATRVEFRDNKLTIQAPEGMAGMVFNFGRGSAIDVTVRVPTGSSVNAKTATAPIQLTGEYDVVQATTASAPIRVEKARSASVNTASGDLQVTECTEEAKGNTVSGDLEISYCDGPVSLKSVSGDVRVGYTGGAVTGGSVSGDITIGTITTGNNQLKSVSGAVSVGIAPGTGVWMDLNTVNGTTSSDLAVGDMPPENQAQAELRIGTVSGNIDIFRSGN